jgi:hypothetical protein
MAETGYRSATFEDEKSSYAPSKTEILLEKICESFETSLLKANVNNINGTKLVRESKPAVMMHPDGSKMVLQFQYTRFSPFKFSDKAIEVYNANRAMIRGKRKLSANSAWHEMMEQVKDKSPLEIITNEQCIPNLLCLHRWNKELYFAVFSFGRYDNVEDKLNPFLIHEHAHFNGKLPDIHIVLSIQPYFVIGSMRENTGNIYDEISIDFPRIEAENKASINTALSLHPLDNLKQIDVFQEESHHALTTFRVHSEVPRTLTMGWIAAYLRKLCLNKEFY